LLVLGDAIESINLREFHNFLTYFKDNPAYNVVCFTGAQIPGIEQRSFPQEMAGKLYRRGIPVYPEQRLAELIKKHNVEYVCLSYSDLKHVDVMHKASIAMAHGANFLLLGPDATQLKSTKPIISITAVRTGCGKSQTSRKVARILRDWGYKVVAIRHPMPYGDLKKQEVQRFTSYENMVKHDCTIEEQEEYTPWIEMGIPIYAGVDYAKILTKAEQEADVIIWDGGNNDFSFYVPDLKIVVVDPHRAGHELLYHPGETNFLSADVIVINKEGTATTNNIKKVMNNIELYNSHARIVHADSPLVVDKPNLIRKKRVLVVEDGPSITHGELPYGAGTIATRKYKGTIVDAEKSAVGSIKEAYKHFPHLKKVLPALGYGHRQIKELETTINKAKCDVVVDGSPFNLQRFINVNKPIVNVRYTLKERGRTTLKDVLKSVKL
jgi:predicted GTPase